MEQRVQIPTTLFGGPPDLNDITKLAQSQVGFMNIFAYPLFDSVTDILPPMRFAVDQIKSNQDVWKGKIARIEEGKKKKKVKGEWYESDGFQSPRSGSPDRMYAARSPQTSHPEGLPASGSSPEIPKSLPLSTSADSPNVDRTISAPAGVGEAVSTPGLSAKTLSQDTSSTGLAGATPTRVSQTESEDASRRSSGIIAGTNTSKGTFNESSREQY
jgi:3',5'-cyclic-nucleotide phosphodiesterase